MKINFYFVLQRLQAISDPRCSPEKGFSINNRDKYYFTEVSGSFVIPAERERIHSDM